MLIRLFSLLVAFILFISSSGLLIQSHFCQNQLQSRSVYVKPGSCHENDSHQCEAISKKCCKKKLTAEKDNCCHDVADFVKLDLDQHFYKNFLKDKTDNFNGIFNHFNQKFSLSPDLQKVKFFNYKPPLIEFDLQLLFQIFIC